MVPVLLRVLMIGNSFSVCVGNQMPQVVQSVPGYELELTSAYIGGCSLERHWNNIVETEANPDAKQYRVETWKTHGEGEIEKSKTEGSINELISRDSWDVITIQQASPKSWDYGTYQPFADSLVGYIKEHAPHAKIWVQQTWAYRADDGRILPGGEWGFDQAGMHERIVEAYGKLADHLQAPVIPTGFAVRNFRARVEKPFVVPTAEEKAALAPPALPEQSGDVVGNYWWKKDKDDPEKQTFSADTIHLNGQGHYLQACVWFLRLFDVASLPDTVYKPDWMDDARATLLRKCAEDAVKEIKSKE